MKKFKKILMSLILTMVLGACTSEFEEINKNPSKVGSSDLAGSAIYLVTKPQYQLYAPNRYPYWRGQLIHGDRYAGYFTFGFRGSWWNDGLGYSFSSGYTDATIDWLLGVNGDIFILLDQTKKGAPLENDRIHALGLVLKGLYYQMFTDIVGEIPYKEVEDVTKIPVLDSQIEIYKGVIAELDEAMTLIGDSTTTGSGQQELKSNDLYYGGNMQLWKKLANSLKLRMALRAFGASEADFASTAISQALAAPLLQEGEDALLKKDNLISQWGSAAYGDIWHNFGGNGSKWRVSKTLIDYLRVNNDPRLSVYSKPADGGVSVLRAPEGATQEKQYDFIKSHLTNSGVTFTENDSTHTAEDGTVSNFKVIEMAENTYYVGQPVRINSQTRDFAHANFFSQPSDFILQNKNENKEIASEVIFTAAEAYFLQAEAAIRGIGSGNANALYRSGIEASMKMWGVDAADITTYMDNETEANLVTGRELEQIATQRWVAIYTDGFEGWANVRKSGYPADLAAGVDDIDIYSAGTINGAYPQRMRYGSTFRNTNATNLDAAIARQGPDKQDTKLWWAK